MPKAELPILLWLNHDFGDATNCENLLVEIEVDDEGNFRAELSGGETDPYIEVPVDDLLEAIRQAKE